MSWGGDKRFKQLAEVLQLHLTEGKGRQLELRHR